LGIKRLVKVVTPRLARKKKGATRGEGRLKMPKYKWVREKGSAPSNSTKDGNQGAAKNGVVKERRSGEEKEKGERGGKGGARDTSGG